MQRSYRHSYHHPDAPRDGEGGHEHNGSGVSEGSAAISPLFQAGGQSHAFGTIHPEERGQEADTQQPEQPSRQDEGPGGSKEVPGDSNEKGPAPRLEIVERAVSAVYGIRHLNQWFMKVENPDAGGPQNDFLARVPNPWNMWVGKCSCSEVVDEMENSVVGMVPKTELHHMMLPDGGGAPTTTVSLILWTNPMAELGIATYPSYRPPAAPSKDEKLRFYKLMIRQVGGLLCMLE